MREESVSAGKSGKESRTSEAPEPAGQGDDDDGLATSEEIVQPPMALPSVVIYTQQSDYRAHFEREYCREPTVTFDGIRVRFRKRNFDHCCWKSTKKNDTKDSFCPTRASRIDWIRYALQLPTAELYVGWNKKIGRYDFDRRVAFIEGCFVTVIQINGDTEAHFITAYHVADRRTRILIRGGPKWIMN